MAAAVVAGWASCLAVQLSSSRLLYIMGRDGVLPRRVLGRLDKRTKTPVFCLLVTGAMCILGLNLSLETAMGFTNFGAFLAFTAVNACVIAYYVRHRRTRHVDTVNYLVLPALGMCVTIYMITRLSELSITIGLSRFAIGVAYLVWMTRGFRRPTPESSTGHETDTSDQQSEGAPSLA
ncbi:APC family permease [Rhodococcus sp. WS4]|nr:APC family permease [Rhodococcus sp. WS4]